MATSSNMSGKLTLSAGTVGYRALGKIREELTCAICLDILTDPRILPCHHSFCLNCLQEMVSTGDKVLKCPNCSKECKLGATSVAGLPTDFKTNSLLEFLAPTTTTPTKTDSSEVVIPEPKLALQADDTTYLAEVTCPACKNIYSIPRRLDCDHTLCTSCIHLLLPDSNIQPMLTEIACPCCEIPTYIDCDGVDALPLNSDKYGIMLAILQAVNDDFGPEFFSEIPESYLRLLSLGFVEGQNSIQDAEKLVILLGAILIDENDEEITVPTPQDTETVSDTDETVFRWSQVTEIDNSDKVVGCCKCC